MESAQEGTGTAGSMKEEQLAEGEVEQQQTTVAEGTRRRSGNQNLYTIDRSVGLITVTAPRPLLRKVDSYIASLKNHLYKQITIEAKIIEVVLTDASSIGINWSEVLKNFNLSGAIEFGAQALGGQVYPYIFAEGDGPVTFPDGSYTDRSYDPTRFVSKIRFDTKTFNVFLNALQEEGQTKVLSNPKISVMNGQPALITVGRNVTYIDNIESDLDTDSGVITYTVETERVLSGIGMAITATVIEDDEVIMNLVPVTSELLEPIEYRTVGNLGGIVGLPIINIREMSTTVKVKNGEMLVIGGLISDDKDETGEFLPVLGDIPLVKYLFGYEEKVHTKRELIILLKPVVI
jgi:general secretion pathway protein D/MSHA biogenesis protein MshL